MIPSEKSRFKPRSEAGLLSRLIQDAWQEKQNELKNQCASLGVVETIVAHLRPRYPSNDMAVLLRYGQARKTSSVVVRIHNDETDRWDHSVSVDLPNAILVPNGAAELYACGPRYSEHPTRGVKPDRWSTMTENERAELIAFQDDQESGMLPKSVEPYFKRIVDLRNLFRAEYKQASAWPGEIRKERGAYPTWGEIADQFPVLGAHIRSLTDRLASPSFVKQ